MATEAQIKDVILKALANADETHGKPGGFGRFPSLLEICLSCLTLPMMPLRGPTC